MASPIFPIGDVGDIGASNRTCGAGDAGHDASGVEDLLMFDSLSSMHNVPVKWTKQGFCKPYATPSSRQLSDSLPHGNTQTASPRALADSLMQDLDPAKLIRLTIGIPQRFPSR